MKNPKLILSLFLLSIIMFSCASDDDNENTENEGCDTTFVGSIELNTQNEVDEFIYNCYEEITYLLKISGEDITNLDGLQNLTYVGALVLVDNDSLINIDGIQKITSMESLDIINNISLLSLDGLENLTS